MSSACKHCSKRFFALITWLLIIGSAYVLVSCKHAGRTPIEPADLTLNAGSQAETVLTEPPVIVAVNAATGIPPDVSWHLQLNGTLLFPDRDVYDIDLFDTPKATIQRLKQAGRIVVCYFSAGSYENWRPDAASFPTVVIGKPLDGWAGEWWLDVRQPLVLKIMKNRLNLAAQKGCDGVDPDNVNGHQNDTGFDLTAQHLITYNRQLVAAAHQRGLLIGLKNTLDLVTTLESGYDFALNESCYTYHECHLLRPFAQHGKAVLIAEYRRKNQALCRQAKQSGYQLQFFKLNLDAVGMPCN